MKSGVKVLIYIVYLALMQLSLACSQDVGDNDDDSESLLTSTQPGEKPEDIFGRYEVYLEITDNNCPQGLVPDRNSSFEVEIYNESDRVLLSLENITGNPQDIISGDYDSDEGAYSGNLYQVSALEDSGGLDCELVIDGDLDADFCVDSFSGVLTAKFSLTGPECDQTDTYELNYLLEIPCETTIELNGYLLGDASLSYYSRQNHH